MSLGWNIKKLDEIAIFSQGIQVGLAHHKLNPEEGYVRFIRIVDYTQNTDDIRYVKDPGDKYFVNEDDIVMVRYGTPGLIGRGKSGVIANNLFKITITQSGITNDYLSKYLSQYHIQKFLSTQGSATMPALNFSQLKTVDVQYPELLEEQKQIVAILDQAFSAIDQAQANIQQNIQNAQDLFQSYLQQVFYESTESIELGDIVEVLTDYHANGSYKVLKEHVELKVEEDFAWMVRSTDFEKKFKNEKRFITKSAYNYLSKSKLFGGEIIMSKIGNAGKVYFMPETERPCSLAMNLFLIRLDSSRANNEYVYRYLNSTSGKAQIAPRLKGAATQTITKDNVRSLMIPLASLDKQREKIDKLKLLESEFETLEKLYLDKLLNIEELKKSLLQKAFNGELTQTKQAA